MNSKNKGNTFERKIANILSERFKTATGKDQSFRRNIDSGSFFGGTNKKRIITHDVDKASFGDIICPINFQFTIECKHYKSPPSMSMIMKQSCKEWDKWIIQSTQDGLSSNKKPLIIVKYDNIGEIVIISEIPQSVNYIIKYQNYYVIMLAELLSLDDSYFLIR